MMQFDCLTLGRQAREPGYVRDPFEKVCRGSTASAILLSLRVSFFDCFGIVAVTSKIFSLSSLVFESSLKRLHGITKNNKQPIWAQSYKPL